MLTVVVIYDMSSVSAVGFQGSVLCPKRQHASRVLILVFVVHKLYLRRAVLPPQTLRQGVDHSAVRVNHHCAQSGAGCHYCHYSHLRIITKTVYVQVAQLWAALS